MKMDETEYTELYMELEKYESVGLICCLTDIRQVRFRS